MDKHNENLMDDILLAMAARTSKDYLTDPEINKYKRFNDCYTYVARTIREYRDNPIIQNSDIKVYSLGGHLGHCVVTDDQNNIIVDDFKDDRTHYNPKDGSIKYKESENGSSDMGNGYKLDHNSFKISVKDFLEITDNVKTLIDYKSNPDNKGKFVSMLNEGVSAKDALDLISASQDVTHKSNMKKTHSNKNKI